MFTSAQGQIWTGDRPWHFKHSGPFFPLRPPTAHFLPLGPHTGPFSSSRIPHRPIFFLEGSIISQIIFILHKTPKLDRPTRLKIAFSRWPVRPCRLLWDTASFSSEFPFYSCVDLWFCIAFVDLQTEESRPFSSNHYPWFFIRVLVIVIYSE